MAAIQPVRRPLDGLNPYDAESVRQYALHRMTDDLVRRARVTPRLMCAQGETPSAVATMKLDLFTFGGRTTRAVKTVGEAGGERIERIVALMYEPGDVPGSPTNLEFFASKPTPVCSDGWIGVAPVTELDLFPLPPR